jgi:hypothetical protein
MMDQPVSCTIVRTFSIATTVVHFVDFASQVIKGTSDVRISSSSQPAEVVELSTIADNLTQLLQDVESKLRAEPFAISLFFGDDSGVLTALVYMVDKNSSSGHW